MDADAARFTTDAGGGGWGAGAADDGDGDGAVDVAVGVVRGVGDGVGEGGGAAGFGVEGGSEVDGAAVEVGVDRSVDGFDLEGVVVVGIGVDDGSLQVDAAAVALAEVEGEVGEFGGRVEVAVDADAGGGGGGSDRESAAIGSASVFVVRVDAVGVRFVTVGDPPVRLRRTDGWVEERPVGSWSTPRLDVEAFEVDLDGHRVEWTVPVDTTDGFTAEADGGAAAVDRGGVGRAPAEEVTLPPDAVAELGATGAADEVVVSPATTTQPGVTGAGSGGRGVGGGSARESKTAGGFVRAVRCPAGHPNPLTARQCRICGQAITDHTVDVVVRPVLARLVFDSGKVVLVDRSLIIGRRPTAPAGGSEEVALVVRTSAGGDLSRVHAVLGIDGWDLSLEDAGSLNGTEVQSPDGFRRRVREHDPVPVGPGCRVVLGGVDGFVIEAVTES